MNGCKSGEDRGELHGGWLRSAVVGQWCAESGLCLRTDAVAISWNRLLLVRLQMLYHEALSILVRGY
jgi:hypothetical protein